MKKIMFALACLGLMLSSCKKDEETTTSTPTAITGSIRVEMEHVFGGADFALGTAYTTGAGEVLNFNNLRYYVSNIQLTKSDGSVWIQPDSYYLVDLNEAEGNLFELNGVPAGTYTAINFMIGVDSTRNVSGAQTGALSVSNNMFWSWSTGYIFAKIEGTSAQSSTGDFSYHLGGFSGANKAQRSETFNFDPYTANVTPSATPQIHMTVDLKSIFDNADHPLSVATLNTVHMPGSDASKIATNFFESIAFEHIHN